MENGLLARWIRRTSEAPVVLTVVVCICGLGGTPLQSMEPTDPPTSLGRTPVVHLSEKNEGETIYMNTCREKGVPIPPDWSISSSDWVAHGDLSTILLTPNHLEKVQPDETTFASVWSYAHPTVRGACVALGRSSGTFEVICQSAETGYACFWRNDPFSPDTRWTRETSRVSLSSLRDPEQGFGSGTSACTECHRGNNVFLVAPDDPTWATVLRPTTPRPTFTTLVDPMLASASPMTDQPPTPPRSRFLPLGGKAVALSNPLPTSQGCSGACHELHDEILKKGRTPEGYVRIPRPMGPNCARTSPDDDPARDCYR